MIVAVALRQAETALGGHPLPKMHIARAADHVPAGVPRVPFEEDMRGLFERAPVAHRADRARSGGEQAAIPVSRLRAAGLARGAAFGDVGDHRVAARLDQSALVVDHPEVGGEEVGQRLRIATLEHRPEEARVFVGDLARERVAGGHGGGRCRGQGGGEEEGEGHGVSLLYCVYNTVWMCGGKPAHVLTVVTIIPRYLFLGEVRALPIARLGLRPSRYSFDYLGFHHFSENILNFIF